MAFRGSPKVKDGLVDVDDGGREDEEEESTEFKLALLTSLHPHKTAADLLDLLLASNGSVEAVSKLLQPQPTSSSLNPRKRSLHGSTGYQSSLSNFAQPQSPESLSPRKKKLTKKGTTLHLYAPEDVAAHTPCSIRHNFLPPAVADALLHELLAEVPSFSRETFQLFDNVVQSPHTFCFYVDGLDAARQQQTEYIYNGRHVRDVRETRPQMRKVAEMVQKAVNEEIAYRIKHFNPNQKKLRHQSPLEWRPNTSFVNCYTGGKESVGYHSDQLTYLGPRAVIGSISLGVAREFRVRRVVPRDTQFDEDDAGARRANDARADEEGQIAIHLPHNSLLVMHAEMQEEWKHSIAPTQAIDPHPIAGNRRINITYRCYRDTLHPKYTPRCKCNVPTVLRCVQKQKENRGRYMWMCHAGYTPGKQGCSFFQWAEFDDNGEPPWSPRFMKDTPHTPSEAE